MRRSSSALGLLPSLLLVLACIDTPTGIEQLVIRATASRSSISVGETDTLTFRLLNTGADVLTLTYSGGCQFLPYVQDAVGNVVFPPGAVWVCVAQASTITLPPYGEESIVLRVRGGLVPDYSIEPVLPPGRYRGYAELRMDDRNLRLRSPAVAFEIL